jgi:hypothetical protein
LCVVGICCGVVCAPPPPPVLILACETGYFTAQGGSRSSVPITEVVSSDFLATVQPQLDEYQAEKEMANATRFSFMPPEPTVPHLHPPEIDPSRFAEVLAAEKSILEPL